MIRSYFARQFHEIDAYFTGMRILLDSLPEDVREDLLAHTSLGRLPRDLEDVRRFLEERYPPFPETRRFSEEGGEGRRRTTPLLRAAGFESGNG